jgi:hypothetical protein
MSKRLISFTLLSLGIGCASDPDPLPLPSAACSAAGGGAQTAAPVLLRALPGDEGEEAWLGSPAVADLDRDGKSEVIVPRGGRLLVFGADGARRFAPRLGGRIWAPPVVGDFVGDGRLEIAAAARDKVYLIDAGGQTLPGFPVIWRDEVRGLAGGDLDGDGKLEIVAITTTARSGGTARDLIQVFRGDGSVQRGFPPNSSGTSGCDAACYVTGGYDQNVALGPIDDQPGWDLLVGQDNAYLSWHRGSGVAFDANPIFRKRTKVLGVRFLLDYALAQQGYAADEDSANQAHFTNSAPALADLDGDGKNELIVLGSVQNASQQDRLRGVALWAVRPDGTRPPAWSEPLHIPQFLSGLFDFDGTNVVAATNAVAVGDLDPQVAGPDVVFAGFDGKIHAVGADRRERWSYRYTTDKDVLTGGVALADLTRDGVPEVVFASYSTRRDASHLFILNAGGGLAQKVALPGRGAMPVPTVADVDGDGTLEIVVSLKDADGGRAVLLYSVPGSGGNCLMWPTGRGNLLRTGHNQPAR